MGSTPPTGSDQSAKGTGSNKPPAKTTGTNNPPAKAPGTNTPPAKAPGTNNPPAKAPGSNPPPANPDRRAPTPEKNENGSKKRAASPSSGTPGSGSSQTFCSGKVALRLFVRDTKFPGGATEAEILAPGPMVDERSKSAMAHCFHVALALLERSTGHDAFIKVATRIVTERRLKAAKDNKPEAGLFAGKDINDMPKYINEYLKKIREIGLPVCVTRGVKGHYGLSQRQSWGLDMKDYDPKTAAIVYLNKGMVEGLLESADAVENCMVQQRNINAEIHKGSRKADAATTKELESLRQAQEYAQKSFERAIFCMSVTLAHEFVHCFTGYLTGLTGVRTPPRDPPLGPYGNKKQGEAGWEWCNLALGGLAFFYYTKGSPEAIKSGYYIGIPVVLVLADQDWETKSKMYMIQHSVVKKIIEMKDWDSAYKSDPKWMHKVRAQDDKGILYPDWVKKYYSVIKIWDKWFGIPDVSSGAAAEMGQQADIGFASAMKPLEKQITKPLAAADIAKPVKA